MGNKRTILGLLLALGLVVSIVFNAMLLTKVSNLSDKVDRQDEAFAAIHDSIKVTVDNGVKTFSKSVPEIDLEDILESDQFNTLSGEQQAFFMELKKVRGLISASQARLASIDSTFAAIHNPGTKVNDSTYCYAKGDSLNLFDTTGNLKWGLDLTFDDSLHYAFRYRYDLLIKNKFVRGKDGSVTILYQFDDPNMEVLDIMSFKVPPVTEGMKPFERFVYKNRKTLGVVGGVILFGGGAYIGHSLGK